MGLPEFANRKLTDIKPKRFHFQFECGRRRTPLKTRQRDVRTEVHSEHRRPVAAKIPFRKLAAASRKEVEPPRFFRAPCPIKVLHRSPDDPAMQRIEPFRLVDGQHRHIKAGDFQPSEWGLRNETIELGSKETEILVKNRNVIQRDMWDE